MAFQKGNKLSVGKGKPKGCKSAGSGRTPEWLKAECQKLIEKHKLLQFLADVASGKDVEQKVNDNGEVIKIPADVRDRLKAMEMLANRAYGMPVQQNEVKMDLSQTISVDKTILETLEKSILNYKK